MPEEEESKGWRLTHKQFCPHLRAGLRSRDCLQMYKVLLTITKPARFQGFLDPPVILRSPQEAILRLPSALSSISKAEAILGMARYLTREAAELLMTVTTLHLTVGVNCREAVFPAAVNEICLGRYDASRSVFPDLDLSPDGGFMEGVSRQHAKIYQRYGRLFVEDAGSKNGTFLNNCRLIPRLPYRLQEGDTLQLGRLRLVVEFD